MTVPNVEISKTFTEEQIEYLRDIHDACVKRGASAKSLAPLNSLAWIRWEDISSKVLEWADVPEELRKRYGPNST